MTYAEAEKYLLSRQDAGRKDDFGPVLACLARLGDPHRRLKAVHVTGTNGKGSVCALFESSLRAAGLRTGLFISPHLLSLTERIAVAGRPVSEEVFSSLLAEVAAAGPDLGFFELLTCMAFLHFDREKTDLAVIEVGIGGLWDSTNVLPAPELSVICSVDYDHKQYLGGTLAEIAAQKAGIIKQGGVCAAAMLPPEARTEVLKAAQARGAQAHFYAPAFEPAACDWERGRMTLRHKKTGETFDFGLLGPVQAVNATLVYEGLDLLRGRGWKLDRGAAAAGFAAAKWPARFQVLRAGPGFGGALFVLDGAHNAEAARAFADTWRSSPLAARPAAIVAGMLQDKERAGVLQALAPLVDHFIFTRPGSPRAADPCALADEMAALRPDAGIEVQQEPAAALLAASRGGLAAVVGSFYLAGTALRLLAAEKD